MCSPLSLQKGNATQHLGISNWPENGCLLRDELGFRIFKKPQQLGITVATMLRSETREKLPAHLSTDIRHLLCCHLRRHQQRLYFIASSHMLLLKRRKGSVGTQQRILASLQLVYCSLCLAARALCFMETCSALLGQVFSRWGLATPVSRW